MSKVTNVRLPNTSISLSIISRYLTTVINVFLFVACFVYDIHDNELRCKQINNHFVCTSFFYRPENFKDLSLIIPEILEFIELQTFKFGLVYVLNKTKENNAYSL